MLRAVVITLAALALAAPISCRGDPEPEPASPPARNLILIVIDTLRADHLGAYGYSRDTSPSIDAFARGSLLFRNAYTPRPKTTPAMASLFSGVHPRTHGLTEVRQALPGELFTLPEHLRSRGYATAAIVTNVVLDRPFGFDRGFDHWQYTADRGRRLTDAAIETLARIEPPFLFWVHYTKPHAPYRPRPEFSGRFIGDELWAVEELEFSKHNKWGGYRMLPNVLEPDGSTNPHHYIAEYDAEIRDVDAEVGRLLAALESQGAFEDSVIVLTSDHGESLGDHDYYFGHGMFPYDSTARIPLLIRVPGRAPGETSLPASLVDLPPTLLGAVGLPGPDGAEGIDLLAAVDAGRADRHVVVESGYDEPQISLLRRGAKLIHIPEARDRQRLTGSDYELYRLDADPRELDNRFGQGDPVEPDLRRRLDAWRELPRAEAPTDLEIPEETEEKIQALGYAR